MPVKQSLSIREGFSLVEMLIALTVLGALLAIALPSFNRYRDQQKVAMAVADLRVLDNRLKSHKLRTETFPAALNELLEPSPSDPWGQSYQYLRIEGEDNKTIKNTMRRDKNVNPINSDFDLYSKGADKNSKMQLDNKVSVDDVVRANDGAFYGLAATY
jgi:general secretion pathway protein G